jgi:TrmH family RNA methyltransferase
MLRPKKLQSPQNPLIKEAINIKEKRSRYRHEAFLIEGQHLIESALDTGAELKQVFFTEGFKDKALLRRLAEKGVNMIEVTDRILLKLSDTETPQGILAIASYKPLELDDIEIKGIAVVCDGIQDPGNLGTIIRTADATGSDAVILLPGTCDAFMPKALRASAGSIFNIPVIYEKREKISGHLRKKGVKICAMTPDAKESVFDVDLSPPIAFVFGNESRGISPELKKASDIRLKIPITGRAESLNVASSAAVCLYEALRQRFAK